MANREGGPPFATLPHLVLLKMIAGRTVDGGDVARMLGHQDVLTREAVRMVARRVLGPEELADLDKLIELGRLEYGAHPEEA
jgi:integrase